MVYVALETFELHLQRVMQRALLGGHAASESTLRRIYESSLRNLRRALNPVESGIDEVRIFDNSALGERPRFAVESKGGQITRLADEMPLWLMRCMNWTPSDLKAIREGFHG
jgi:predicted ABC-type ATPase